MFRMPEKLQRIHHLISGAAALVVLTLTARRWVFDALAVDAVYYDIRLTDTPAPVWPFLTAAAALMIAAAALKRLERIGTELTPCWLLAPLLFLPQDFFNLAATLAVIAWSLSRCPWKKSTRGIPREAVYCLTALLAAAAAFWSFYLQTGAFRRIFLAYQDWGEYTECYLRIADGGVPLRALPVQAGHFNPLPTLLMSALVKLWRSPEAVFFVSAVLLGMLPVLIYRLARKYRLPRVSALVFGFVTAASPVLINQSLSFFYGFHPVLFQGPLIILFFIFERRKCRLGMAATIILSLLVQETAAVLWFGYALYLLACRRFRGGTGLALACVVYFVIVSKVVMPFANGGTDNPQLFHYAQLGDSLWAVMLSPFLRPRAFWETVFQKQNLFFAAALLLPCGVLALRSPRRLLIALPLFAGVIMQNSNDVKNPSMQYGFEITVVLLCTAVAAAGNLLGKRTAETKRALRAGVPAVAAMTMLCALLWSRLPIGKYSAAPILDLPDATKIIGTLRGYSSPQEGRVLTTKCLRLYHMFDRRTAPLDSEWRPGDTIMIDLADAMEPLAHIRRRLLEDERAVPCFPPDHGPSRFVVWKIAEKPRQPWSFLCRTDEAGFRSVGLALQQDDPAFEARVVPANGGAAVFVRLKTKVDYDVAISIKVIRGEKEAIHTVGFGNIYPMWYATPGDTFWVPIPGGMPTALQLAITRRK